MDERNQRWLRWGRYTARSMGIVCGALIVGFTQAPGPHHHLHLDAPQPGSTPADTTSIAATVTTAPSSTTTTIPPAIITIAWGQTLWSIANQWKVSVRQLEVTNELDGDIIYAGQQLVIPPTYLVVAGDTLKSMARTMGCSESEISTLNPELVSPLTVGSRVILPYPKPLPPSVSPSPVTTGSADTSPLAQTSASPADVQLLAHLVNAEAGNQPFEGQVAVAAVVLNRVNAPGFPKTIAQVIEQPGQFQSVSNGSIYLPPSQSAWIAAKAALQGWDPTGGALYYYNPSLTDNQWIRGQATLEQIGNQVFAR